MNENEMICIGAEEWIKLSNYFSKGKAQIEGLTIHDYPDYFGGSYINNEGKLVIMIVGDQEKVQRTLYTVVESDNIKFESCAHSYKHLTEIMTTINHVISQPDNKEFLANALTWRINDINNIIEVELVDCSPVHIENFKKRVCNSPVIHFLKSNGIPLELDININAGQGATSSAGALSIGYRADRYGVIGVITAGHAIRQWDFIYINGVIIGECTDRQWSGNVDAAFINVNNINYTPTNYIQGSTNLLSTQIYSPTVGQIINKYGAETGLSSGTISSTNASKSLAGSVVISNLIESNYNSNTGDSGCVVYALSGTTRYTVGIHHGRANNLRYTVKAGEIDKALGTKRF